MICKFCKLQMYFEKTSYFYICKYCLNETNGFYIGNTKYMVYCGDNGLGNILIEEILIDYKDKLFHIEKHYIGEGFIIFSVNGNKNIYIKINKNIGSENIVDLVDYVYRYSCLMSFI